MKKKGNNETDDEKEINSKEIENVSLSSPSKFSPDKKSDNREEEPQRQISELLYESEAQKYQIEDLKSTIVKLQNENQYVGFIIL